jgi:hypothetical protein
MKKNLFLISLLFSMSVFAETADLKVESFYKAEMTAIENNDYAAFIAKGSNDFKKIPQASFAGVVRQLAPRLKAGYTSQFVTTIKQGGQTLHLWKLSFTDKGDDAMAKIVVDQDKILGFWIQ